MRRMGKLTGLASAVFLFLGVLTAGSVNAWAGTGGRSPSFAARATAVGLTSAQARTLQDRVNAYIAKLGGTQVDVNKVRLNGGQVLLLTLPGEQRARDLSAPVAAQSTNCAYYYFCAYEFQNYVGDSINNQRIDMYDCTYYGMPWGGYGSFKNNQTPGTVAKFYNAYKGLINQTLGAYTESPSFNWTPVWYVKPC